MSGRVTDAKCRKLAKALGMRVQKSRARNWHYNNNGGYQLIDDTNTVRGGDRYDLDLAALHDLLIDYQAKRGSQ